MNYTAILLIQEKYKTDLDNFDICYKVVDYKNYVETFNVETALHKMEKDCKELYDMFCYCTSSEDAFDKAIAHTKRIWDKHIFVPNNKE